MRRSWETLDSGNWTAPSSEKPLLPFSPLSLTLTPAPTPPPPSPPSTPPAPPPPQPVVSFYPDVSSDGANWLGHGGTIYARSPVYLNSLIPMYAFLKWTGNEWISPPNLVFAPPYSYPWSFTTGGPDLQRYCAIWKHHTAGWQSIWAACPQCNIFQVSDCDRIVGEHDRQLYNASLKFLYTGIRLRCHC